MGKQENMMSGERFFNVLSVLVIITMLVGPLAAVSVVEAAPASLPPEVSHEGLFTAEDSLEAFVTTEEPLASPVSPRSRNGAMIQDRLGGALAPAVNQAAAEATIWLREQRAQTGASLDPLAAPSAAAGDDPVHDAALAFFPPLWGLPAATTPAPEPATQAAPTLEPAAPASSRAPHAVYLPVLVKLASDADYISITPEGRELRFPSGRETITFAEDGLPAPLQVRFAQNAPSDRPLSLYPVGSPFAIEGRWPDSGVTASALDRDARPRREVGAAKPSPAEYGYHATVAVQLSEQERRFVVPDRLALARVDARSGKWALLPVEYDPATGIARAQTTHLGTFVLVQTMAALADAERVIVAQPRYRGAGVQNATVPLLEVIVDDLDAAFKRYQHPAVPGGPFWFPVTSCVVYKEHAFWTHNRSTYELPWLPPGVACNWATWTPALPEPGYYLVSMFIPGSEATTSGAAYKIVHNGQESVVSINQAAASGAAVNLGAFEFAADGSEYVYLSDVVPETAELGSKIGFDAAFFTYAGEEPPSPEEIAELFALGVQRWQSYIGDPASASTGNHVQQIEVVRIPGLGGTEMALLLSYNGLSEEVGLFGRGFSTLADMHLQQYYDGSVMIRMPDGQGQYWQAEGDGFVGWQGVQGELEAVEGGFRLTQPNQTVVEFQATGLEGRVVRIEGRHGNGVSFLWAGDDQLSAMTDDSGRSLLFEYDGDFVSAVTDPIGRRWEFGYEDEFLTEYTDANDGTYAYTYTGEGYLETMTDPEGGTYLTNEYDAEGRVVYQQDGDGSTCSWEYGEGETTFTDNAGETSTYRFDDLYRVTEIEDAMGYIASYEYDDDYNLIHETDKRGNAWDYTYDDRGNLLTATDPDGYATTYTYNEENDLTGVTDALERTTTYVWDDGNLARIERPDGTHSTYAYDGFGQMRAATDPNGHTTEFTHDGEGNMVRLRTPEGHVTTYAYDPVSRMTGMTDANSHAMSIAYDANDNVTRLTDPKGQPTVFEYDGNGMLTRMVDRRGGVWRYVYDVNLKLVAETDPEGHTTTHEYDVMYNRIHTTDPNGNPTFFRYNANNWLIEVEDALGGVTAFDYDPNGNLVTITDAMGYETHLEYDALSRTTRIIDALSGVTAFEYDAVGRLVKSINPRGATTRYAYDEVDQLVRLTDALSGETRFDYDPAGNLVAITDANGHTAHLRYDDDDRLIEREDPGGHVTAFEYDGVGNLVTLTNPRGYVTTYAYDANDNLERVIDALAGETAYAYDEEDALTAITDPNGHTTRFEYDRDGLLVKLIEAGGQETRFEFDDAHNMTRLTNAKGNVYTFDYDELNRQIAAADPLSYVTGYEYDKLSRLVAVTDAEGVVTGYEYDPLGRLTAVVQNALPGEPADHETNVRTEYAYDPVGNLTAITDANGHVTRFDYDLLDRLTRETNPLGNVWRYEYDPVGNLTRRVDANGAITDYAYDADDLLTEIAYPDGSAITFAYDANHNQTQMVDGLGTTTNTYDALDRLTSATNHLGQQVGYRYDPASNRTAVIYPDGRVVRTAYDETNYPIRVTDPDDRAFAATYDPTHNITRILYPNMTEALMTYDDADRLTSVVNRQLDGDLISSYTYEMDNVGNRVHSEEYYRWRQPNEMRHDYVYDPLYRLVQSRDSEERLTRYAYDAAGNRLLLTSNYDPLQTPTDRKNPYTVEYTYNAANQLLTTDHSDFGVTHYTYDANGNRIRREGPDVWVGNRHDVLRTDYTYDFENRLASVKNTFDPGNGKWSLRDESAMTYDGYGRLFRRMHDMHQTGGGQKWVDFVYDGLDPIVEYVEPSPQYDNYYRGFGRILELHEFKSQQSPYGTAASYYHYDGLGSVSALTKHRGQSAHTYRYWDFGMALDKNDGTADSSNFTNPHNHYTYTGQNWDDRNALYHFYAREYDPVTGTWLQQDPYRGRLAEPMTLHRYGYVGGNPVNYRDWYGFRSANPEEADYYQYDPVITQEFGVNSCGLISVCSAYAENQDDLLQCMRDIESAADDNYKGESGIQPSALADSVRTGLNREVRTKQYTSRELMLEEIDKATKHGGVVIIDYRAMGAHNSRPSSSGPFAHFARVKKVDGDNLILIDTLDNSKKEISVSIDDLLLRVRQVLTGYVTNQKSVTSQMTGYAGK
jgi:RHS repeat-associated protein